MTEHINPYFIRYDLYNIRHDNCVDNNVFKISVKDNYPLIKPSMYYDFEYSVDKIREAENLDKERKLKAAKDIFEKSKSNNALKDEKDNNEIEPLKDVNCAPLEEVQKECVEDTVKKEGDDTHFSLSTENGIFLPDSADKIIQKEYSEDDAEDVYFEENIVQKGEDSLDFDSYEILSYSDINYVYVDGQNETPPSNITPQILKVKQNVKNRIKNRNERLRNNIKKQIKSLLKHY